MAMDDRKRRVLQAVVTLYGIDGEPVGSGLLKLCASFAGSSEPLTQYRWYFLLAGVLLFPGIILIGRLPHFQSRA